MTLDEKSNKSFKPMRARSVANLLFEWEKAKNMKSRWDKRTDFYPTPIKHGKRGIPHLYSPIELIRASLQCGDVGHEQVEKAIKILEIVNSN